MDHIIYYLDNGVFSNRMVCGNRYEIEYVVLSIRKYCKFVDRIYVVGSEPPESIKDLVFWVPCDNPYKHCKDANLIYKVKYAIENIPDLSDDFVVSADDQVVTKECSIDDLKPRIIRKYTDWTSEQWKRNAVSDYWHKCLHNTLRLFGKDSAFFEPHIFSIFNKYKFIEMCNEYDWENNNYCILKTLYFNFVGAEQIYSYDTLHLSKSKITIAPTLTIYNIPTHLSWTDGAFMQKCFQNLLNKIIE